MNIWMMNRKMFAFNVHGLLRVTNQNLWVQPVIFFNTIITFWAWCCWHFMNTISQLVNESHLPDNLGLRTRQTHIRNQKCISLEHLQNNNTEIIIIIIQANCKVTGVPWYYDMRRVPTLLAQIMKRRNQKRRPHFGKSGCGTPTLLDHRIANMRSFLKHVKRTIFLKFETNLSMTILEHVQNNIILLSGRVSKTKVLHKLVISKKTDNKKTVDRRFLMYLFTFIY